MDKTNVILFGDKSNTDLHGALSVTLIISRRATRNGLVDGTKCQAEEQKGNSFMLLCIAQTTEGSIILQRAIGYSSQKWNKWIKFQKLYLSMEEWLHDCNDKEEVNKAQPANDRKSIINVATAISKRG
jgi:hypothetical protein